LKSAYFKEKPLPCEPDLMPTFPQHRLKNSDFRKIVEQTQQDFNANLSKSKMSNLGSSNLDFSSSNSSSNSSKVLVNATKSATKSSNTKYLKDSPKESRSRSLSANANSELNINKKLKH
jgi:hypothetical protein